MAASRSILQLVSGGSASIDKPAQTVYAGGRQAMRCPIAPGTDSSSSSRRSSGKTKNKYREQQLQHHSSEIKEKKEK